ncbi:hypothetical protein AOLI_G00313050 [Acnodon oligacanthus]
MCLMWASLPANEKRRKDEREEGSELSTGFLQRHHFKTRWDAAQRTYNQRDQAFPQSGESSASTPRSVMLEELQ